MKEYVCQLVNKQSKRSKSLAAEQLNVLLIPFHPLNL